MRPTRPAAALDSAIRVAALVAALCGCTFDSSSLTERLASEAAADAVGATDGGQTHDADAASDDVGDPADAPGDGGSDDAGGAGDATDDAEDTADDTADDTDAEPDTLTGPSYRAPEGAIAFMAASVCPDGWGTPPGDPVGRVVVGVSDSEFVGRAVGAGSAFDPRLHTHVFNADVEIAGASVAGGSACCNDGFGASGRYLITGETGAGEEALPIIAERVCRAAPRDPDEGHPFPAGTILHFDRGACPEGWAPVAEAAGRVMVGLPEGGLAGEQVGEPLTPGELPTHTHAFTGEVTVPGRGVAAGGGRNDDPARQGTYAVAGNTSAAEAGLPYVQYLTCRAEPASVGPDDAAAAIPSGTVAWFERVSCPAGWSAPDAYRGRILVAGGGAIPAGTVNTAPPLSPREVRRHTHRLEAVLNVPRQRMALGGSCCFDRMGANGSFTVSGVAEPSSVGMPYVAYLACARD